MKVQTFEKPGLFKRIMFGENARKPTHRDYDPVKDLEKEQPNFKKDKVYATTSSEKGSSVFEKQIGQIKKSPKEMSYLDYIDEKNKIEANIDFAMNPDTKIPYTPLFCTPNCQHNHVHNYQDDFWKSNSDPRADRPGICFLEGLKNAPVNNNTKNLDNAS